MNNEISKYIVETLTKRNKTMATMESCTGGLIASTITNIDGASEILKFSAITYSNEYKVKMGVDRELIDKYSVYSMEVARNMALKISEFTKADYGIGVTGKLGKEDLYNKIGNNIVYVAIYDNNKYYELEIKITCETKEQAKKIVVNQTLDLLKEVIG